MNDGLQQAWRAVEHAAKRAMHALSFPTDDPGATAVVALVVVVAGLMVAVAFMAFASPGRSPVQPEDLDDSGDDGSTESDTALLDREDASNPDTGADAEAATPV